MFLFIISTNGNLLDNLASLQMICIFHMVLDFVIFPTDEALTKIDPKYFEIFLIHHDNYKLRQYNIH